VSKKSTPAVEVRPSIDSSQVAFTLPQASTYSGLSVWQLRTMVWGGQLTARKAGRNLIVLRGDLDAALVALPRVTLSDAGWFKQRQVRA